MIRRRSNWSGRASRDRTVNTGSGADLLRWQRARMELWYANTVMTAGQVPSANQWTTIQRGLDELLVSPAVKRRAGIELRRNGVDADVVAAGEMVGKYQRSLTSV